MKKRLAPVVAVCLCAAALFVVAKSVLLERHPDHTIPAQPPVDVAALRTKAERGDAQAQYELGGLYALGEGVTNSYAEAAKWYRRAADQSNANAQVALGELYQAGQGVRKDLAEAGRWFLLSAGQHNARAQYNLGFIYESGRGVPQDQAQAAEWFRLAAEQGEPLSQYDLGQRYDLGVGVPVDRVEALKWLTLAAAQGQTDARERRDKIKSKMTRAEISEAEKHVASFSTHSPRQPPR